MFHRIYMNDQTHKCVVLSTHPTVEEAGKSREVAGDLIVDVLGTVVNDRAWLWEWELLDPACYAMQSIKRAVHCHLFKAITTRTM